MKLALVAFASALILTACSMKSDRNPLVADVGIVMNGLDPHTGLALSASPHPKHQDVEFENGILKVDVIWLSQNQPKTVFLLIEDEIEELTSGQFEFEAIAKNEWRIRLEHSPLRKAPRTEAVSVIVR